MDEYDDVLFRNGYVRGFGRHSQTFQLITFGIVDIAQDIYYQLYYNKLNGNHLIFRKTTATVLNLIDIFPTMAYNDYFISIINPIEVMEVKQNLQQVQEWPEIPDIPFTPPFEVFENYTENSNPVLCFFKLRPEKVNMKSVYYE